MLPIPMNIAPYNQENSVFEWLTSRSKPNLMRKSQQTSQLNINMTYNKCNALCPSHDHNWVCLCKVNEQSCRMNTDCGSNPLDCFDFERDHRVKEDHHTLNSRLLVRHNTQETYLSLTSTK